MSTLDKLKQKLNLQGASKGLENINAAAKKTDMTGLANGIESVRVKFSALEVMGVTALTNITNSAINAGKRIVSALTIDPIKTGFQEYETQINAVQTILANTQSKGTTIDQVNAALEELNHYADMTIYNFTEMTRNIGTFTAAGIDLETSVNSIQGIANLAAVSGSNAQQASTAMYQLSQALAAGTVKLMDWNSVVNAGMGGQVFQDSLKETARVHGIAIDDMIESEGSFRETLSKGWLTSEILNETLMKFTMTTEGLTDAEVEANREKLRSIGYTEEQIDGIFKLGKTATDAATKVKTFTQLWDVLKEAAQSGWTKTWQLILGDFEGAKALFTPLSEFFTNIINKISDARNALLENALTKSFKNLAEKVKGITQPIQKSADAVKNVVDTVKDYGDVVNRIIGGEFGTGQSRWDKLTESGYDWAHAQNLVNEKLGDATRHATNYKEAQQEVTEATTKTTEADSKLIAQLVKLSDAELKAKGYTEEQIASLRELEKAASKLGLPIDEFISKIDEIDGRWILLNSFKNIGLSIVNTFKAIGQAWREIFPPMQADTLFNIIAGFHKLTTYLEVNEDTANKITRTFKGLFAILDIIRTLVMGPVGIAFKILKGILGAFNIDVLDATAYVGDAIVKFRDWLKATLDFTKVFKTIVPYIKKAANAIKEFINAIKGSEKINSFLEKMTSGIRKWFDGLKETDNIPKYIFSGLINGLKNGIAAISSVMIEIGKTIINTIKKVLGIHSPSKEFFEIGKNIIQGLFNGIKEFSGILWDLLTSVGLKIVEVIKGLDLGKVLAGVITVGFTFSLLKIAKAIESFGSIFDGVGDILQNAAGTIKAFTGVLKSFSTKVKAEAIKTIATAIAILVGCIVVLTLLDPGKVWASVAVLGALAGILVGISAAAEKIGSTKSLNIAKFSGLIMSMASALMIIAIAAKLISGTSWEGLAKAGAVMAAFGALIVGLLAATKLAGGPVKLNMVTNTIAKLGTTMLLLAIVTKILGTMSWEGLAKAGAAITFFSAIIVGLMAATKLAGTPKQVENIGQTIRNVAAAIMLMAIAAVMMSMMSWEGLAKASIAITLFAGIIVGLMAVTKLAGTPKQVENIGKTIRNIGAAILLMAISSLIMSMISWEGLAKATIAITIFAGIITGLIAATKLAGENELKRVGVTLLLISMSIAILALVSVLLGMVDIASLAKGIIAVGILATMMALMIKATKDSADCHKNIMMMAIAIGIMAASVILLSFIDPGKLAGATIALSLLMGMFALIEKNAKNLAGSLGPLIVMSVAIGILTGAIYLLAKLPIESVLSSAAALSVLMLSMSTSLAILSKFGGSMGGALKGVLALTLMAIPLVALVGILALMQNIQNATKNATILSAFATALTVLLIPLSVIGVLIAATGGTMLLGILALTLMAVPLLAFVGVLALMQNIQNATKNVELISGLMKTMTGCLIAIALVAPLVTVAVIALAALTGLIVAIGVLATGVGALMTKFPALEDFLDKGIPILEKLANGIGSIVGNLVSGFMTGVASGLPEIGTKLSEFMTNAMPFINGAKLVDESVIQGAKNLAGAVAVLTMADLLENIVSFLSGGSSFATLGTELSNFMTNAMPFITGSRLIDPSIMDGVKCLAESVLILTAADVLEGLTSWFTGGSSLADFGAQLGGLGTNLNQFVTNLGTFDESKIATVDCAGKAIKALAEAAKTIPNEGGLWSSIVGENSLSTFGAALPVLGTNLSGFINNLGTFDESKVTAIDCAGKAIKALASSANEIPNEGGLWSSIVGENSLATFGTALPELGTNLSGFINNLGTFDESKIATVNCAGKAIKALATAASNIPNEGGFWSSIVGENSLATFGSKLPGLATNIASFVTNLGTFGEAQIATVNSACKTIKTIASLGKIDLSDTSSGLGKLGNSLSGFAKKISKFVEKLSDIGNDNITTAITKIKELIKLAQSISGIDTDSIKAFGNSLKKVAEDGIKDFVKAFSGESPKNKVIKAAKSLLKAFIKGAKDKKADVEDAFEAVAEAAVDALNSKTLKDEFKAAGKYLGEGLVEGIEAKEDDAYDAGYALGQKAVEGEKDGQQSKSPSKLTIKAGKWLGEGLVIGIKKMASSVYNAGHGMGEIATSTISDSIAKISDFVNSDIDAQPTIRPVLDLSAVQAGAGTINGMFASSPSVGLLARVNSISSMMGNQNGVNSDVISAINKLGSKVENMSSNTYTINGITYDDGSNITDAVQTLVRAARVERRK